MLTLREISHDDLTDINKMRNDIEIVSCLVAPFRYINYDTDQKWFEDYMKNRSHNVRCVLCAKDEPANILGYVGLLNIDYISRKSDFYIQIAKKNQGKKYGYTAIVLILQHAFYNLNLNRVELVVLEYNERAIRLYEKAGFKKEGLQRQAVYKNGKYENLIFMAILKEDFIATIYEDKRYV